MVRWQTSGESFGHLVIFVLGFSRNTRDYAACLNIQNFQYILIEEVVPAIFREKSKHVSSIIPVYTNGATKRIIHSSLENLSKLLHTALFIINVSKSVEEIKCRNSTETSECFQKVLFSPYRIFGNTTQTSIN